jgi:hypothetical protein
MIETPDYRVFDQWEAQKLALIQMRANVQVYSTIDPEIMRELNLDPINDIAAAVEQGLEEYGSSAKIAVLPQGPLTIPYLEG